MKKVLLAYLPFCTPAAPPYSITYLASFLKANCSDEIMVLDLNLEFHKIKFPEDAEYFRDSGRWADYEEKALEYKKVSFKAYADSNRNVVMGGKPELFAEMLEMIASRKPDIVAFSIVYSSQAFYASCMLDELARRGIKTVIGGPAANEKLGRLASASLCTESDLLEFITGEKKDESKLNFNVVPDFSAYNLKDYFTPFPVIPVKTSSSCYYRQCAFCTHYSKSPYKEYPVSQVKEAILKSGQKHFFLIDDMIPAKRLLEIAEAVKGLGIKWACQLKPTKEFTYEVLKKLNESGLVMLMWGIESGSSRILDLIKKGTNPADMEKVLEASHRAGIKNIAYMLFGFPTETKSEFLETIDFLKRNEKRIDLVSCSIFGLQKGTAVYSNPSGFCITEIIEEKRTFLEPSISYKCSAGLSEDEASKLLSRHRKLICRINKYPKIMNFFREHMLCML